MKTRTAWWIAALSLALAASSARAQQDAAPASPAAEDARLRSAIASHLGRPYVWGASGLKSYDCSGFVWRVMQDEGILIKRTTARKYYLTLPKVADQDRWAFGNIVFFDHLTHCGIVESREAFYHAAVSAGTHRSSLDPFWLRKVSGVRAMPRHDPPRSSR